MRPTGPCRTTSGRTTTRGACRRRLVFGAAIVTRVPASIGGASDARAGCDEVQRPLLHPQGRGVPDGLPRVSRSDHRRVPAGGEVTTGTAPTPFVALRGSTGRTEATAAAQSRYHASHREEEVLRSRAYREAHRDSTLASHRAYNATHRDKERAYREAHRDEKSARNATWYAVNRREINVRRAAFRAEHRAEFRARQVLDLYTLSSEEYDAILVAQGGACADCRQPETRTTRGRIRNLAVDHDHACCPGKRSCGKCLRGIVCGACNDRRAAADRRRIHPAVVR